MIIRNLAFCVLLLVAFHCSSQIQPAEGAKLNYTQVMFDFAKVKGAKNYLLQIAEDSAGASFNHCVTQQKAPAPAAMVSGLEFGKKYKWRYAGTKSGHAPEWNGPYHFEIPEDSMAGKKVVELVVTKNDYAPGTGGLIVNDCTHTIVDRSGKPVWYLTDVKWRFIPKKSNGGPLPPPPVKPTTGKSLSKQLKNFEIRPLIYDLRLTPFGTVTDMEDSFPTERTLAGSVLWKAPNDGRVSGSEVESYNHDFKRLPNGNYMMLGTELWRKLPASYDSAVVKAKYPDQRVNYTSVLARVEFGTIIEYDRKNNIIWSWNSQNYLDSDAAKPVIGNPLFDYELKPHMNACSTDKNNEFVYAGFRDISRIIKIDKKTGQVVSSWGEQLPSGEARHAVNLHKQHDANLLNDGTIAVFNNNDFPNQDSLPSVLIISQQGPDSNKIIWKYTIDLDSDTRILTRNGGNVDELKNGNLLVCMGNLDKIFEITRDKKMVWAAEIKVNGRRGANYSHRLYRAHYISSLYPCYFTFVTSKDTVALKRPNFKIKVFNTGSESDTYNIKVSSASGVVISQFNTATLLPKASASVKINPGKKTQPGDKIEVVVTSKTNADFVRKSWVYVQ